MGIEVGDLLKHKDDGSLWLSRVTKIDSNNFLYITDEFIIYNSDNHILSDTGIGEDDIITNYKNISLDDWFEKFPEYRV